MTRAEARATRGTSWGRRRAALVVTIGLALLVPSAAGMLGASASASSPRVAGHGADRSQRDAADAAGRRLAHLVPAPPKRARAHWVTAARKVRGRTADPVPVASDGGFLRTAAYENENSSHRPTRAQALAAARSFALLVSSPGAYDDHLQAMHAVNPRLRVLGYMNAMFAQKTDGSRYPDAWYLRDATGAKVRSNGFGNYLMDPRSDGWLATRTAACRAIVARGFDGCMLDMVSDAPISKGYVTGQPVDVRTGATWDRAEYLAATTRVQGGVRDAVVPRTVLGNGFGSGLRYWDADSSTGVLLETSDGNLAEGWLRTGGMAVDAYRSEALWRQDVDLLVDVARRGKVTSVLVKLWSGGTVAQKDAYHRYALASFLLGTDGRSYYTTSYGSGGDLQTETHAHYDTEIGTPTGAYAKVGGVYSRTFTAGRVLVNPTAATVTVDLTEPMLDTAGASRSRVTLPPHTGEILRAG